MSVPEHSPAVETPVIDPEVSKAPITAPETEAAVSPKVEEPVATEPAVVPSTEEAKKDEAAVEVKPASEGVLGYKAPGIFKQFRYVKHFFWLSEEPLKSEHLTTYIRDEKSEIAHPNAAWAQETGKGVLFFTKRAEDKTTPAGLIMMADVTDVTSEGTVAFHFKTGTHTHKFEAANSEERAGWLAAIEAQSTEAKAMKETVTGSDSYKKTLENYAKSPVLAAAAVPASKSNSRPPKKSLDTATAAAAATPAVNGTTDGATEEETSKETKSKSRSQSRKRASIFGTLRGKKEEKDEQKELKKEEKAEEKAEKKQEKKAEVATKKEEAKEEHDPSKAKEAVEAAAVAAVPAAAIAAEKKDEDKTGATTPTDKKGKRSSVFGSLFKKTATSPTAEKTEKEVGPDVPAKDMDALPVADNAPQIEEPIENKPIDTAAVVAPVDTVTTPAAEEPAKETSTESPTAAKSEEKTGALGFLKKQQAKFTSKKETKEEKKEEGAAEAITKDPVEAAAPVETPAVTETTPTTTEERPAREKRRTSLFGSLGTLKKKTETGSEDTSSPAEKREKSPLPGKLTGLFRRPSKAVKPTEETPAATETTEGAKTETVTNGEAAAAPEESKIVGDVVPDELHATVHDSVTSAPTEVKASA